MLDEYDGEDLERNTMAALQVATVGENGYIKTGILLKKGMGKMMRPWALRTIVLFRGARLCYYDGNITNKENLKGDLSLVGASVHFVTPEKAEGRENAFQIINIPNVKSHQNNILLLSASSQDEAQDWVEALEVAISGATAGGEYRGST